MESDKTKPTILIVDGVARTGSSFMGAVINSLPQTMVLFETLRLPKYYQEMHGRYHYPFNISEIKKSINTDFGKNIPSYESFEKSYTDTTLSYLGDKDKEQRIREKLRKRCQNESNLSYVKIFQYFHEAIAEEYQVPIIGGKTTFCHCYKNQMLLNIPNLKWIDVLRDARGVISSGIASPIYRLNSLGKWEAWREQIKHIQNISTQEAKARTIAIKYEDLILKKQETIETIVKFLQIKNFDYDQWIKQPILKNDGTSFGTHSSFDEKGKPVGKLYFREGKDFDQKPVYRWKQHLTQSQKWLITTLYKKELQYLNYPTERYFLLNPKVLLNYMKIGLFRMFYAVLNIIKKTRG